MTEQQLVKVCWDILSEMYLNANPSLDIFKERADKRQINNRLYHLPEEKYSAIIDKHIGKVSKENCQFVHKFVSECAPFSIRGK